MTAWHVDDLALRRWIDGSATLPQSASVEQHLLTCPECRERVGVAVRGDSAPGLADLDVVWTGLREVVETPKPAAFERLLARVGLPAQDAQLVAAARAFRAPWLAGVLAVLAFVALAAALGHARGQLPFLLVAPLLPGVAVAIAYDPDVEPALEQELATPYPALRLVLLRSIAVLAVGLPVVVVLGLFLPGPAAFLWLLPAVGFVAGVLALSTWMNPLHAAGFIGAVWFVVVSSTTLNGLASDVLQSHFQVGYVLLSAVSGVVFLARERHLRELRSWRGRS
jgi:hypothetical protein